jgi:NADH-quinone oxidoreductase subunit M
MLYERRHTRMMEDYGGIAKSVPVLTFFMVFSVLASAGLPGLNGFVGEFLILLGAFKSTVIGSPVLIAFATTGVILAAVYLLWMVYQTFFGALTNDANRDMADMNGREFALMLPLAALMLIMGFAPNPFLQKSENATDFLLETMETKRTAVLDAAANQPVADTAQEPTAPSTPDVPAVPIRLDAALDPLPTD